jgi:hypothetical protein
MKFLTERPCLEHVDRVDTTALSWVATIADEGLGLHDQGVRDQLLKVGHKERGAKNPLLKLLMVTSPNGTQAFTTWTRGIQNSVAKLFFKKVFEPFGDEAVKKALGDMHVMNTRHAQQIKKWTLKRELEEDQDKAGLLQIEEGFSDEKIKAKFLEIARQQISDRKAREERRALCDGRAEEDSDDDSDRRRRETLTEEHFKQCVVELLNWGAESKLFVVNTKCESDREGAVRDCLPIDISHKVSTLEHLTREGKDTHNAKMDILETVVKTNYDLAQADLLPNLDKDRYAKPSFIKRAVNVTKHLTGEAPDKKAVESKLAKLQATNVFKCTECEKKLKEAPHGYRVKETGICYPISSLDSETAKNSSILVFCSPRCENKWDEKLMCPKCKTFDFKYDQKGIAPYPCPFKLLDNFAQYDYCRQTLTDFPVCPIARTPPKFIRLPLCTTCDNAMMPRTPDAPHLTLCFSHDDVPGKRT